MIICKLNYLTVYGNKNVFNNIQIWLHEQHLKMCRNLIKNIFACGLFQYILKMEGPTSLTNRCVFIVNLKINEVSKQNVQKREKLFEYLMLKTTTWYFVVLRLFMLMILPNDCWLIAKMTVQNILSCINCFLINNSFFFLILFYYLFIVCVNSSLNKIEMNVNG